MLCKGGLFVHFLVATFRLWAAMGAELPTINPLGVKNVHLVWSNHFDAGFADYVTNILNRYMTGGPGTVAPPKPKNETTYYKSFFLEAINSSKYFRSHPGKQNVTFSYMTQSFIVDHYLNCDEERFPYQHFEKQDPLKCPSDEEVEVVKAGLKSGDLYFHAFPHNAQPELMDAVSFETLGLKCSADLAERYGSDGAPNVLSQRDVTGLTRGAVPVLARNNVFGISIGANDGSPPPIVPSTVDCYVNGKHKIRSPFLWRDEATDSEVIVDIHPGGYGGVTGGSMPDGTPFFSRDGLLCDCIGHPQLEDVLCYAWRGDNYGPNGTEEVLLDYKKFAEAFPHAEIRASTLDTYFALLNTEAIKASLPVVTSEIGDTWMYGCSSDPLKMAQMRAIFRVGANTAYTGATPLFKRLAIKLSEHTWGGCGCLHNNITRPVDVWTAEELAAGRKVGANPYYRFMEQTWVEQRAFVPAAVGALQKSSALRKGIEAEFAAITAPAPTPETLLNGGYNTVARSEWADAFDLKFNWTLEFDPDTGAISSFSKGEETSWADKDHQIAAFMYRSHSFEEACQYGHTYNYNHGGEYPYKTPLGCQDSGLNTTGARSKRWYYSIHQIYRRDDHSSIVLNLNPPSELISLGYGAPASVYITLTAMEASMAIDLTWEGKRAVFLPESSWFEFTPKLQGDLSNRWVLSVDKMGKENIDTSDVVAKAGAVLHGLDPVYGGMTFRSGSEPSQAFRVESLDAGLMSPGYVRNTWNFEAYDGSPARPQDGAAFNLHSNLYTTNYVVYYPWIQEDSTSRFRFIIRADS